MFKRFRNHNKRIETLENTMKADMKADMKDRESQMNNINDRMKCIVDSVSLIRKEEEEKKLIERYKGILPEHLILTVRYRDQKMIYVITHKWDKHDTIREFEHHECLRAFYGWYRRAMEEVEESNKLSKKTTKKDKPLSTK